MTTADRRLVAPLGMTVWHLCWVLHTPSELHKGATAQRGQELLAILQSTKHHSWQNLIPLDESFFCMHTGSDQMWLPRDEAPKLESAT
jgi:hypothetical protein